MYAPAWTIASAKEPSSCSIVVNHVVTETCNSIYLYDGRGQPFGLGLVGMLLATYACDVEQKTSCIDVRHTRNLAMGLLTCSMLADFVVAARDEDITMRAAWKVVPKIEHRIICVIKQEQPFFALSR